MVDIGRHETPLLTAGIISSPSRAQYDISTDLTAEIVKALHGLLDFIAAVPHITFFHRDLTFTVYSIGKAEKRVIDIFLSAEISIDNPVLPYDASFRLISR